MKNYTLITGASQGFGKALAIECAERNMNLILVSLPRTGLIELGEFLMKAYPIDVYCIEADLTQTDQIRQVRREARQRSLKVQYLINNAGMLSQGLFEDLECEYFQKQIALNVLAPTILTRLFLNDLKECAPSGVLNVGSLASYFYLPGKCVYGATKAYLSSFSQSLHRELKQMGISVTIISPGGMNTNPTLCCQNRCADRITRLSVQEPEDVAYMAIQKMLQKKERVIPGKLNRFFLIMDALLPKFVKDKIIQHELRHTRPGQIPERLERHRLHHA
ncbi:MAG: SDR family NAD(P)-dependent oxidoreductase [Eudoraea sp.]|nr:SDR family NAD(P)-dependent oxidoreductase [Eudoraea sp.]